MSRTLLHISDALKIPAVEAVTQTIVVYGAKGSGKTNLGAVVCEELSKAGQRFCFIDPVGVNWGLRHSADGRGEGLKLILLGGRHGDLPIEPTGGSVVADFVSESSENVLLDISGRADGRRWSTPDKVKFVADYTTRLLERQGEHRHPLMQVYDEAARFCPQMLRKGAKESERCLEALEVLVEEGRNAGVGVMLLTQRSARMAKSVSELAELMISFRIIGPNSTEAVLDWFGSHIPKANHMVLLEQLRKLPRGHALVVSPGWLEYEGVAAIRKRETFDSSSTPTGTERKLLKRVRPADLESLRAKIAETVEKAEAADVSKLRPKLQTLESRVRQLETENETLRQRPIDHVASKAATERAGKILEIRKEQTRLRRALEEAMKFVVKVKAVDFDGRSKDAMGDAVAAAVKQITDAFEIRVQKLVAKVNGLKDLAASAETAIDTLLKETIQFDVQVERKKAQPFTVTTTSRVAPKAPKPRQIPTGDAADNGSVPPKRRLILNALAFFEGIGITEVDKTQLALFADAPPTSGAYKNNLGALRSSGLIVYPKPSMVALTDDGRAVAESVDIPTSTEELHAAIQDKLPPKKWQILKVLINNYPTALGKDELADEAGAPASSGGYKNNLGSLRSLGLIDYPAPGMVQAQPILFLDGR